MNDGIASDLRASSGKKSLSSKGSLEKAPFGTVIEPGTSAELPRYHNSASKESACGDTSYAEA